MKNGEFKIEKGVPIPARKGRFSKYPFLKMKVGDSFLFHGSRHAIASAAGVTGRRHKMKFSTRMEGDGFRCWRVK